MTAEESVLGSMLISQRAVELACDLDSADFTTSQNKALFENMIALYASGSSVDTVTVISAMPGVDVPWLTGLTMGTPSAANVEHYIRIVRQARQRREFTGGMSGVIQAAADGGEFIAAAEDVLSGIIAIGSKDILPAGEYVDAVIEQLGKPRKAGISTGFVMVDLKLKGLRPGQLVVIAGTTGMGKTSFAMNVAMNVARKRRVAVFSLEMTREELIGRAIISLANVNEGEMNQTREAGEAIRAAGQRVRALDMFIDDKGGATVEYIKAQCHRLKPDLIVIDYLGLMDMRGRKGGTRENEVSATTRALKVLAKECKCVVLLLAQLNRGVDARPSKKPVLSDLRESGSIEQDADIVMFLHRPGKYDEKADQHAAALDVAKHRNGQTGAIELSWDGAHFRYSDKEISGATPFDKEG
jgi:replicative DNA helicase